MIYSRFAFPRNKWPLLIVFVVVSFFLCFFFFFSFFFEFAIIRFFALQKKKRIIWHLTSNIFHGKATKNTFNDAKPWDEKPLHGKLSKGSPIWRGKRNQGGGEEKAKRIIETKKKEKQNDNLLKRQFFQLRVGKFSRFFQTTAKNVLFDYESEGGRCEGGGLECVGVVGPL